MPLSSENLNIGTLGRLVVSELSPGATKSVYRLCRELLQPMSCEMFQPLHTATDFQLLIKT